MTAERIVKEVSLQFAQAEQENSQLTRWRARRWPRASPNGGKRLTYLQRAQSVLFRARWSGPIHPGGQILDPPRTALQALLSVVSVEITDRLEEDGRLLCCCAAGPAMKELANVKDLELDAGLAITAAEACFVSVSVVQLLLAPPPLLRRERWLYTIANFPTL